ncbi:MAG: hypothetical protein R3A10_00480 [Caldilineaceae bacterium]
MIWRRQPGWSASRRTCSRRTTACRRTNWRGGDLITHQYAQVQARPPATHRYPHTMGGWLWFHTGRALMQLLGAGDAESAADPEQRQQSWALGRVVAPLRRHSGDHTQQADAPRQLIVAWLVAAFYAATYFFYATTTEHNTACRGPDLGHRLRLPALAHGGGKRSTACTEQRSRRLLFLLAFLCGLSPAHMLTIAFIVPPLIIAVLWQRPISSCAVPGPWAAASSRPHCR